MKCIALGSKARTDDEQVLAGSASYCRQSQFCRETNQKKLLVMFTDLFQAKALNLENYSFFKKTKSKNKTIFPIPKKSLVESKPEHTTGGSRRGAGRGGGTASVRTGCRQNSRPGDKRPSYFPRHREHIACVSRSTNKQNPM